MTLAETLIARARLNRLAAIERRRAATNAAPAALCGHANLNAAPRTPEPDVVFTSRRVTNWALAS
ncbi:MAG: hypothetical protein ACK4RN_01705 [Pseudorhodobacter sp.]